jgi:tryptophanyl-tRNA synthetase
VELARNLAQRFNSRFGETFIVPEPVIRKEGARLKSLQDPTKKMSKSDPSSKAYISILDDADLIAKKIRSAVTDSDRLITAEPAREGLYNLLTIFSLVTGKTVESLALEFHEAGMKALKDAVCDAVISYLAPVQVNIHSLLNDRAHLEKVLIDGSRHASAQAKQTLDSAKKAMGLIV